MAALKVGMKIMVPWKLGDTLGDNIYVVERIRRSTSSTKGAAPVVEVRTERQRIFQRSLTGYTSWDLAYMQDCFKAGTMEACA
jgi:hypothetical protein